MLAVLNRHPRDKDILFEELHHKYAIKGDTSYTSTTTFIKKFFNEFNADKILAKMTRFGTFSKRYGDKTQLEVKKEWELNGKEASERGTRLHKYIENFYNSLEDTEPADLPDEVNMFYNFFEKTKELTPYRTEWYIWDEENKIAGSIDMVFRPDPMRAPQDVVIYDWKCSKGIKDSNKYERGKSPIAHLDDCNKNHYFLQQNVYKYILEKNYGVRVKEMYLVVLHKTNSEVVLIKVDDMQTEVKNMLSVFRGN